MKFCRTIRSKVLLVLRGQQHFELALRPKQYFNVTLMILITFLPRRVRGYPANLRGYPANLRGYPANLTKSIYSVKNGLYFQRLYNNNNKDNYIVSILHFSV